MYNNINIMYVCMCICMYSAPCQMTQEEAGQGGIHETSKSFELPQHCVNIHTREQCARVYKLCMVQVTFVHVYILYLYTCV